MLTTPPVELTYTWSITSPLVRTTAVVDGVRIGSGSLIVMLNVILVEPPELFAQTVNNVVVRFTDGVPEITPLLKLSPDGTAGVIAQFATLPPVLLIITSLIVRFLVKTRSFRGCRIATGSRIVMLNITELVPPELLANNV